MKRWFSDSYWDFDAGCNLHVWGLGSTVVWCKGEMSWMSFGFSLGPLYVWVSHRHPPLPPSKETR